MALWTLSPDHVVAAVRFQTGGEFEMTATQRLIVETTPAGREYVEEACPPGKKWTVRISVDITETDA